MSGSNSKRPRLLAVLVVGLSMLSFVWWWKGSNDTDSTRTLQSDGQAVVAAAHVPQWNRVAPDTLTGIADGRVLPRLAAKQVLDRQRAPLANGGVVERRLLRTAQKYPEIVFQQEFAPASRAQALRLTREFAYAAGHVLLGPKAGISPEQLLAAVRQQGFEPLERVGEGWRVATQIADIEGVDRAIEILLQNRAVATVEPDYLVFTADEPQQAKVVASQGGRLLDLERQAWVEDAPRNGAAYSPAAVRAGESERLAGLPEGARVLNFEAPDGRRGSFRPEVRMHNFIVTTSAMRQDSFSSVYVQNAYTAGYPSNGGNYLRVMFADGGVVFEHKDHLPFDAISVDLSEYSTVFAYPGTITFRGYLANGQVVSQDLVTDGVVDGTGPLTDFQSFTFNSSFRDVVKLEALSSVVMIDNLVVVLKGQETPLPAAPAAPLVYAVNWNDAPHGVNAVSAVGGPYAPSSHNFGTAIVRQSLGALTDRPLELTRTGFNGQDDAYGQIRFDAALHASRYVIEFDVCKVESDSLALFLDCDTGFVRLDFGFDGIGSYSSTTGYGSAYVAYNPSAATHVRVTVDFATESWTMSLNGQAPALTGSLAGFPDLATVRFSLTDSGAPGGVAIDNFTLAATGITAPPTTPRLALSPPDQLRFGQVAVGGSVWRRLFLKNIGSEDLEVTTATVNDAAYTVTTALPVTVIPGNTMPLDLTFQPSTSGLHDAVLTLAANDPTSPVTTLPLSGFATGVPVASLNPAVLDAYTVAGTQGTKSFVLRNTGEAALEWRLVRLGANEDPISPRTLNDPSLSTQWGLKPSEQGGIDAGRAWTIATGSADVVVAVLDTGLDLTHPDLAPNLATNPREIPGNGIDDDHNSFIDDVAGWNFSANTADPTDLHGHGSHVAGIISAAGNNNTGIAGVAWTGKILPVQFLNAAGSGFTSDAVKAVQYAQQRGAQVINASWGGGGSSSLLQTAISDFTVQGRGVFVAAAGNSTANNDELPYYPAGYAGVVSVAASTRSDELASFSNYGARSVTLVAPGQDILSCYRNSQYAILSGTSMAAPHVSGAAALLLAAKPGTSPAEVKSFLTDWVDFPPSLNGRSVSGGRLNVYRSLRRVPLSWLSASQTSGAVAASGGEQTVELQVDARNLVAGSYETSLAFATNDPLRNNLFLPIHLKVLPASPLTTWQQQRFGRQSLLAAAEESAVWSITADPDADGLSNIVEYLCDLSPMKAELTPVGVSFQSGRGWVYTFTTRSDTSGLQFRVEWSQSLASDTWSATGLQVAAVSSAAGKTTWEAVFTNPAAAPTAVFFRLAVAPSS